MEKACCIDFIFYECRQRFFTKLVVKTFTFGIDTVIFNQIRRSSVVNFVVLKTEYYKLKY